MNKATIFFIVLSTMLGIVLIYTISISYIMIFEEREGARPRDGITVTHSEHIDVGSMEFFFVTTRDPNSIEMRFHTYPNQNIVKPAMIGIYFPYKLDLDETYNSKYVDYTTWYKEEFEHGTVFVKQLSCPNRDECDLFESDQVKFLLPPDLTFDSQNNYRHSIKIKFSNPGGKAYDVFGKFEDSRNLVYGFSNSSKAQATIIIKENADNIHTLPLPEPGMFHNSYNDYSNIQLDWPLTKNTHTFFVDYQMADERQNVENAQNQITSVGITIGLLSIAISVFYVVRRR